MRLAILVCLLPALCAQGDLALVEHGTSRYQIVLNAVTVRPERFAAEELQRFVQQATGAKLPIVTKADPAAGHIYVGANSVSAAAGIRSDDLPPEGFHFRTVGQDIHLVGRDTDGDPAVVKSWAPTQCGTLFAVYELLERYLGVMFCWGDDLGTVVPPRADVSIPATNLTQSPAWEYRALPYGPQDNEHKLYGRRLRLGNHFSISHSHAWFSILPAEKYGQEHPEYYALVKGVRQNKYYMGHHGGQVCTSNAAVIDLFAQAAIDYFKQHPDQDMFSVSPNDGGGFCECDQCRALDTGDKIEDELDQPVLTDRLLHFYNAIAAKVVQAYPDKLLGAYIYSYYVKPPNREKVHPSLYLVNATNSAHLQGRGFAQEAQWDRAWAKLSRHFAKYDIYYYGPPSLHLIAPVTSHLVERLKSEQAAGLQGGYLYIGQTYEQLGAGHYLLAKLMWDRQADAKALEAKYYQALYGPAAGDVKAYYDLLEGRLRQMIVKGTDVDEPIVRLLRSRRSEGTSPADIVAAYWPILDRATALVQQAQGRRLSALEQQRLARLVGQHELLVATVRGMVAAGRLETQAHYNAADIKLLKDAVAAREAAKAKCREYAPTFAKYLADADQEETARVSPDGAFYQLTRNQKAEQITAVRTPTAPKLDGRGSDPVWRRSPASYFLLTKTAAPPSLGARAKVLYDDTNLYVFIDGREPGQAKLLAKATAHDDAALFNEDNVEVLVQPPGGPAYYHLGVGAGGAVYDAAHLTGKADETDVKWDSQAQVKIHRAEAGWSVELALPWAAMHGRPGDGWRLNLYRTRRGYAEPNEYTAISPTFGGYHVPSRFADLKLVPESAAPAFEFGTFDDVPGPDPVKRLRPGGEGTYLVELVTDQAWCGSSAAHLKVGPKSLGQLNLTARVKAGTAYRAVIVHRNATMGLRPDVRPQAPITRVIFRDDAGQAVTPTTGYSWSGADAGDRPNQWRASPHVFTTPPGTTQITFSLFYFHPGEYWVDEVRLEEM